ncbi:MAG: hypothetical protein ABSG43_04855, partial [Solirubrobacteraceae bacterium]
SLNDPATGSNGSCASLAAYICNATSGYDGPTGAGSISGAAVAGGPGIGGPGAAGTYMQNVTAETATLQGGVYPNGATTSCWWQYGPTSAYGRQTPAATAGSASAAVAVTGSLGGLAPGGSYHYRLVAQNTYGTTYGYDFTLRTAPAGKPAVSGVRMQGGANAATLAGWVNPDGAPTTYRFSYGTHQPFRHRSTTLTIAAGQSRVQVSITVRGLQAGATYGAALSASNDLGSTRATAAETFRTPVRPTPSAARTARSVDNRAGHTGRSPHHRHSSSN